MLLYVMLGSWCEQCYLLAIPLRDSLQGWVGFPIVSFTCAPACLCSEYWCPGAQVNETIGRTPTPTESHEVEEQWPANSIAHTMCLTYNSFRR